MIPVLAAVLLLLTGALRLAEVHGQRVEWPPETVLTSLGGRLASGQAQGYLESLQALVTGRVVGVQLVDRSGQLIAVYPAPFTRSTVGIVAAPLQAARRLFWAVICSERVLPLTAGGAAVGELRVFRVPGLSAAGWWAVFLSCIGGWAVILNLRAAPSSASPPERPSRSRNRSGMLRLGSRLGAALNQADLGVLLLDRQLRVRYLNAAGSRLCGLDGRSALNQPVYSVIRLDGLENPFQLNGADAFSETRLLHLRGAQQQPLQATLLRLQNRAGQWSGLLVLLATPPKGPDDELVEQAALAKNLLEALPQGVVITDRYGRIQQVNATLNRLFAYEEGELQGLGIAKLLPVPFLNEPDIRLASYLGEDEEGRPRVVGWRKNATTFPVHLRVHELAAGSFHYLLLIADSSERERNDSLPMRLGRLLDYAAEEIYIFDAHSLYFTEVNREARDNLGFSVDQLGRMTPLHLAPGLNRDEFERDLAALRGGESRQFIYKTQHRRADGSSYPVSLRVSYSPDEDPPVFMALAQDITDQQATEARLEKMALSDHLTSLPNRAALRAHLQRLLRTPERTDVVVLFLDLNRFKPINDTYGHAVGDEVLVELTARLRQQLSDNHFLARLSGDEFVVVAQGDQAALAELTAQRLIGCMAEPVVTSAGAVDVGLCVGVAQRHWGEDASALMQRADKAMYEAKAKGVSGYATAVEAAAGH